MLQLHFSTPKGVDYGVRKRSFRPMLQMHFSTPKGRRAAPLAREAGEGERQCAPPCAPTPLSHPVGEGSGVRAKSVAPLAHPVGEGLGVRAKSVAPLAHPVGEGLGVRAKSVAPLSHPVGEGLGVRATDATIRYNNSGHSTGSR